MRRQEVTDPELLRQLNGEDEAPQKRQEVTDPQILAQLNDEYPDQKPMGAIPTAQRALSIVGHDITKLPPAIGRAVVGAMNAAPRQIPGYFHQAMMDPERAIRNVGVGVGKVEQNAVNTPSNLLHYLAHIGAISKEHADKLYPRQEENIIGNAIKPEGEQAGDTLIQEAHNMLGLELPGAKKLGEILKRPAINADTLIRKSFADVKPLENKLTESTQADEEAKNASIEAKQTARNELGQGNWENMPHAKMQAEEKLAETPEVKPSTLPIESANASLENLENARNQHVQATRNLQQTENQISQHLNRGAAHDVDVASQILDMQEGPANANGHRTGGLRSQIGDVYDHVRDQLENHHIEIDNTEALRSAENRLMGLIQSVPSQAHTQNALNVLNEIDRLRSGERIPANRYLTMIRSAKDYAREARRQAFMPDVNAEERAQWHQRFNDLDDTVEHMEDIFESSIPAEQAENLRVANRAWRTQVKPLQRNTTYQTMLHRGRVEGNIMQTLRGTDRGDVLMRGMIRRNPELLRNVVGQQYAHNPEGLHDIGNLVQEYTSQMPELQGLIEQHGAHQQGVEHAQNAFNTAENAHQRVVSRETKAFNLAEKERMEAEKTTSKREDLQEKITLLDKHIEKLTAAANKKNVALKQHMADQKALDNAKAERKEARSKLLKLGGIAAAVVAPYPAYKAGKVLFGSNNQGEQ